MYNLNANNFGNQKISVAYVLVGFVAHAFCAYAHDFCAFSGGATAPPQGWRPQPRFVMSSIGTVQGLETFGRVQKVRLGVTTSAQRWPFSNGHFTPYAKPPCVCRRRRHILRPTSQTKSEQAWLCPAWPRETLGWVQIGWLEEHTLAQSWHPIAT